MKYWRGYLVAAILAAITWALVQFAQAHSLLVDMVYPHMSATLVNAPTRIRPVWAPWISATV